VRDQKLSIGLKGILLAAFAVTLLAASMCTASERVLYPFDDNGEDGLYPYAGLIFDSAGNLYGTTNKGGVYGVGTVFELTREAGGGLTETVLHSFDDDGKDGSYPYAGLIFDSAGNLYGTTFLGGAYNGGTVFELTPKAGGGWKEAVLHSFNPGGKDGFNPYAGLIVDANGNFYGTTVDGGAYGGGAVFELTRGAGGRWRETVLHSFNPGAADGSGPYGGLVLDKAGNLYGTTSAGGAYDYGTVFKLTSQAGGGWREKVVHSFNNDGKDGFNPYAGLTFDALGNLYGTTLYGGIYNVGAVFELTHNAGKGLTEKVLHSFDDNGSGGDGPYAGVIFDASGNLYGTTFYGGAYGDGMVFELTPRSNGGTWTETVLHNFNNNGKDGFNPYAGLIFDAAGNLYTTALDGGAYTYGTVVEIKP
jgi:uncharacterized repeat protein (TIGR03803 family)